MLSRDADETVRRLVRDNVPFSRLEVHAASLEEAFLALTHLPAPEPVHARRGTAMSVPAAVRSRTSLVRAHTKAQVLEQLRIPISVISSTVFPTLALVFFVLPQQAVTSNPVASLIAVAQLALFGVMSSFLFNYGIGVAEERANPWSSYVRSCPWARCLPLRPGR